MHDSCYGWCERMSFILGMVSPNVPFNYMILKIYIFDAV